MHFNCDWTAAVEPNPDVDFLSYFNLIRLTIVERRPMGVDPGRVRAGANETISFADRLNIAAVGRKPVRDRRILFGSATF